MSLKSTDPIQPYIEALQIQKEEGGDFGTILANRFGISVEERIGLRTTCMAMMLNGEVDWNKGCAIRRMLNITSKELKEHLLKQLTNLKR